LPSTTWITTKLVQTIEKDTLPAAHLLSLAALR